jgi:hypothetical protein
MQIAESIPAYVCICVCTYVYMNARPFFPANSRYHPCTCICVCMYVCMSLLVLQIAEIILLCVYVLCMQECMHLVFWHIADGVCRKADKDTETERQTDRQTDTETER